MRCPGYGKYNADEYHGFDDAGLHLVCLSLSGAWSAVTVTRHHIRLTTNGDQNASVAEDEDQQDDDVQGQELPDPIRRASRLTLKETVCVADTVHYIARWNCHSRNNGNATDPSEYCYRVDNRLAQFLFSPRWVDDLQITFDGNSCKVHQRTNVRTPGTAFAPERYAEPISQRSVEVNVAKSERVRCDQEETADEIKEILVEYQHVLLVLFRRYQAVYRTSALAAVPTTPMITTAYCK